MLLLAIGVGVLIGRSGSGSGRAPAPQVVTVGGTGAAGSSAAEETFTGDWPAAKKGWTVQLQTLPEGTKVTAIEAAKTADSAKGAKSVGALKAEEFPSVTSAGFVIYSGQYAKKAEAAKALGALKSSFPGAVVIQVSSGASGGSTGSGATPKSSGSSGGGGTLKKPAPAKALSGHEHASGKKYVEESAKLPDVVETG